MALSERVYWIILITLFSVFAFIVWFYLFPIGYIDANLAANLFTSSIFMVLTVVFLSWLLNVRQKKEWNTVESEVIYDIKLELSGILTVVFSLIKDRGDELYTTYLGKIGKDTVEDRKQILNILKELSTKNNFELDGNKVSKLLRMEGTYGPLHRINSKLTDIHQRYSKFLSANLSIAIIHIQRDIFTIENQCIAITEAAKYPKLEIDIEKAKMSISDLLLTVSSVEMSSVLTTKIVQEIIKNLYDLENDGFSFVYPVLSDPKA